MPSRWLLVVPAGLLVAGGLAGIAQATRPPAEPATWVPAPATSASAAAAAAPSRSPRPLPAAAAPRNLMTISYFDEPRGFPSDPDPASTDAVTDGLQPAKTLAVYDAPGGRPRAFLPAVMNGLPVTVPIVERRDGWVAVLLPSSNRTIGWLPAGGWTTRTLRDQLIVDLSSHRLVWLRNGVRQGSWSVATGAAATPTPPGRTFVLGRTPTSGAVYAGLDALVLGAIPENRDALSDELRDGHTAIHGWSRSSAFGRSVSNGCVRVPPSVEKTLLAHIDPGTTVHVVD